MAAITSNVDLAPVLQISDGRRTRRVQLSPGPGAQLDRAQFDAQEVERVVQHALDLDPVSS
jgi:hypothetical protein